MASPPPSASPPPPPPHRQSNSTKLDYYYFVIGLALVAIVLLVTNAIAVGCCGWMRNSLFSRGAFGGSEHGGADDVRHWIPSHKYRKKEQQGGAVAGEEGDGECAVCISAFDEGEEVRQLPLCGHSFHAPCIDMWLQSHGSCPVCRRSVLPTPSESMEMSAQFHSRDNLIPAAASRSSSFASV